MAALLAATFMLSPALAANLQVKDGTGSGVYMGASGSGTNLDPYIPSHAAVQSGTWTVQPGNTANTTAWKVDGSAVTQPVSASSLPLPTGASTAAKQPALGTAGSASTDVITVQGITSMTPLKVDGSGVTQPVSGTVTVQQSTASSLKVDLSGTAANATAIKVDNSAVTQPVSGTVTVQQSTASNLKVDLSGTAANSTAIKISAAPATSGGLSIYRNISLVATGVNIKASAGQVYGLMIYNGATSTRFVKLYNKATAPTVGTDTPILTLPIPSGASVAVDYSSGIAFGTGIGIGATQLVGDSDTTAPASNEVVVNVLYN